MGKFLGEAPSMQPISKAQATAAAAGAAYRNHSTGNLPQFRPGSTEALISEVSSLRRRLAANLAVVEESMPNVGMGFIPPTGLDFAIGSSPTSGTSPFDASYALGLGEAATSSEMSPAYGTLLGAALQDLSPAEPSLLSSCIGIDNE